MPSKEYRSWSFGDRPFMFAVAVSLLWHLLWFFSLSIEVNQHAIKTNKRPEIVSLGAVLDDTIFKTLVESRTEFSKTYYRQPEEFVREIAVPQETPERYKAGDVVSMPANRSFTQTLKDKVGGDKSVSGSTASGIAFMSSGDQFEISGDLERDQLLSGPTQPPLEARKPGLIKPEFQIFVESTGKVSSVRTIRSSGDAAADHAWEQMLYEWVFRPSTLSDRPEAILTAKVVFDLDEGGAVLD